MKKTHQDVLFKTRMLSVPEYGKKFCLQTSIHGLSHVAAPGRHWVERLLWVGIVAVAVWGVVDISRGQLQRFRENPTVVTLERDYRTWTNTLPAITICDQNRVNNMFLSKTIKSTWNVEPTDPEYEYYSRFVTTVANSDIYRLQNYEEFQNDTRLNVDLYELVIKVMQELQVKTGSSEKIAPTWSPVMTEAGICYTTNSVAIADVAVKSSNNTAHLAPYTCSYSAQGCYLVFEVYYRIIDYYVHSPYDIAEVAPNPSRAFPSLSRFTDLSSMETRAGRGVRELPPRRRRCLYTHEPISPGQKVYSTSSCRLSCRSRLTVQLCGCKPFYYFYEGFTAQEPMCNATGMWCLSLHVHQLATFGGMKCPCSQQCVDSVYRKLSTNDQILDGPLKKRAAVKLTLHAPRTRYNREIVFHFQDLVVSFGGAAGLFLGASLISFVEIIYFLFDGVFNTKNIQRKRTSKVMPRPYEARIQQLTDMLREIHVETD